MSGGPKRPLGEILVSSGLADAHDVNTVLNHTGEKKKLASELYRLGVASERALARGLSEQHGHPAVVLSESSIDLSALQLVPRVVATQHVVLPISLEPDALTLAVGELSSQGRRREIFDHIEFACGRPVVILLAVESVLEEAIGIAYDAHRDGEKVLVGSVERPPGVSALQPLSIVRPVVGPGLRPGDALAEPAISNVENRPVIMGALPQRPVIFIVDDDDAIRALLARVLKTDGYDVVEASGGRQALEVLRTLRPALLVLDAMLPEVHGYDICHMVKASPVFEGVPVVMVSAVMKGFEHAREFQEVHKADAFVEKPFDVHYLRQVVARLLGRELPKAGLGPEWVKKVKALREEANVFWSMGDLDAAEDAVRRWRSLDPFDAQLYLLQGNVRVRRGDTEGAMKAYERAVAFNATFFAAYKNLAVVYEQLGFAQRSQFAWYRAYELAPDAETRRRIEEHLARA
ncbi:MAG: response regulator [Deltaproteobacteria bacterium]|nr:response regulator [Deltaproteobacteria bacterium]